MFGMQYFPKLDGRLHQAVEKVLAPFRTALRDRDGDLVDRQAMGLYDVGESVRDARSLQVWLLYASVTPQLGALAELLSNTQAPDGKRLGQALFELVEELEYDLELIRPALVLVRMKVVCMTIRDRD